MRISDRKQTLRVKAFLDSGALSIVLNQEVVDRHGLQTQKLRSPTRLYNTDNTVNQVGWVSKEAILMLEVGNHKDEVVAVVANIGDYPLIIGVDWLQQHNPEIDWIAETMTFLQCPESCMIAPSKQTVVLRELPKVHVVSERRPQNCKAMCI